MLPLVCFLFKPGLFSVQGWVLSNYFLHKLGPHRDFLLSGRGYVGDVTEQGQAVHSGTSGIDGGGVPVGHGGLEEGTGRNSGKVFGGLVNPHVRLLVSREPENAV